MLKSEEIERIKRFTEKEEIDEHEMEWIESLFINDEKSNCSLKQLLENDWEVILNESDNQRLDCQKLLGRIHHEISEDGNPIKPRTRERFIRYYMKISAVFFLPLIICGSIIYSIHNNQLKDNNMQNVSATVIAPMGSRVEFILPDSTKGMLNSGSSISYAIPFTTNRKVKLEGEAWFEVTHDEKHPFEIQAVRSTVRVLGTRFNICASTADNFVEVVLQEGKVEFQAPDGYQVIELQPSERLSFQNGTINRLKVDPTKYSSWTQGRLVFRNDPMEEVVRRIEKWFNVKITLADKELAGYSFRATFEDDTLEEVLKCLSQTSPIGCKISPRVLLPDGTYKKEEVEIYKIRF